MTVHVGEIHTDLVPGGSTSQPDRPQQQPPRLGAAQETWRQLRWEAGRDCCRTAAEGFDD